MAKAVRKKTRKVNYAQTKRLTIRQRARKDIDEAMRGMLESYDLLKDGITRIVEPITAEINTAMELITNGVVSVPLEKVEEHLKNADRIKQVIYKTQVDIDAELQKAHPLADKGRDLISDRTLEVAGIKDSLLEISIGLTAYQENTQNLTASAMFELHEMARSWKVFSEANFKYS